MKKIGLVVKEASQSRIKSSLKDSCVLFVIKYSGLSSPDMSLLRQTLKTSKANLFVVKNSVARRALGESGLEPLLKSIDGPCGLVFAQEEPVSASKALCNFAKDHEKLVLEGAYLEEKVLLRKDIEALAKLPSKEVLRAQVVCTLNAPIANFVMTLNQMIVKLAVCLDQIKKKKES